MKFYNMDTNGQKVIVRTGPYITKCSQGVHYSEVSAVTGFNNILVGSIILAKSRNILQIVVNAH